MYMYYILYCGYYTMYMYYAMKYSTCTCKVMINFVFQSKLYSSYYSIHVQCANVTYNVCRYKLQ